MRKALKKTGALTLSVFVIAATAAGVSAASTKDQIAAYFDEFNFAEYYVSDSLGQDVKDGLKKIQDYISENVSYTLDDLNNVVGKIDENIPVTRAGFDYTKYLPTSADQLNSQEKAIYNNNPAWGLVVLAQADYANKSEKGRYGSNSWGTNGDAYRHALWNALGARGTSDAYMASFATAHEAGSPDYNPNSIDTKMDLQNNATGRSLLKSMSFPSRPPNGMTIPYIITNNIANAVKGGKMVRFVAGGVQYNYLMSTNSDSSN